MNSISQIFTTELIIELLHSMEHVTFCFLIAGMVWLIPWKTIGVFFFGHPIRFRAMLYVVPLFLAPFVEKLLEKLMGNEWPTPQQLVGCTLMGIVASCIGLRAFYDGSSERHDRTESPSPVGT